MSSEEKSNYFKLVALVVDVACLVIWKYIQENILKLDSFETFLNKQKHEIVHANETSKCCDEMCGVAHISTGERLITKKQLLVLYKYDENKKIADHRKFSKGKLVQFCICMYSAITNKDVRDVDITLAHFLIKQYRKHEQLGIDNWMEQIKDVRNEIFHLSDMKKITTDNFNRKWTKLADSILGIAKVISNAYAEETIKKIRQTQKLTTVPEYMLKYEILCCDYWKNKCVEFERAQIEAIEKNTESLQTHWPELFGQTMVASLKKTLTKIQTFQTDVDKINIMTEIFCKEDNKKRFDVTDTGDMQRIHTPVLLELDLPHSWDRIQVFDYIDEMRLKGTSDMNIRVKAISRDEFTIFADIVNNVLYDFNELRLEIHQLLIDMLPKASIDTSKPAEMSVNISVLDKEESVPFKSSFQFDVKLRQTFQLIHKSSIRDCIVINDQLVYTDNFNKSLCICDINGSQNDNIILSESPKFISVIHDNDIAVAYDKDFIKIININSKQVKNTIVTQGVTGGISYQNELIYVVINCQKIEKIRLTGNRIESFHCPLASCIRCLSTDTDKLFLNDHSNHTLYCCDLSGSVKWKLTDDKMILPGRVTLDGKGNIYVSCYISNNVLVVSPDGKHLNELLTGENRLQKPSSIYYDKSNDCLLVCNGGNCDAFIFAVIHSTENE